MTVPPHRRLGEILAARGVLSEDELALALAEQQRTGRLLGELIVALGLAPSSAVAAALAEQRGWSQSSPDVHAQPDAVPVVEAEAAPPSLERPVERHIRLIEAATRLAEKAGTIQQLRRELAERTEAAEQAAAELAALRARLGQQGVDDDARFDSDRHLLFVPTAGGYRLIERAGAAPEAGTSIEVATGEGSRRYLVARTQRAPLPDTRLRCAYLQAL